MPLFPFCTPWKHQKTFGLLIFSGDIERDRIMKWVKEPMDNVGYLLNLPY